MDNKKIVLIVILALILALFVCLALFKAERSSGPIKLKEYESEQSFVRPAENVNSEQEEIVIPEVKKEEVIKPSTKPIKKITHSTPSPNPVTQNVTAKPIEPKDVEQPAVSLEDENTQNVNIVKEINSGDVVITTEYKFKSPSKYSFQGYGTLQAPTK